MNKFTKELEISYYITDIKLSLNQHNLLTVFQEQAIRHSDTLGYTLDFLGTQRRGWAIVSWKVNINRYPKCGEKVTAETWSSSCQKFKALRSYQLLDAQGNQLICAISKWAFLDLDARRPTLIPAEMEAKYYSGIPSIMENETFIIAKTEEILPFATLKRVVGRTETDSNGHTNNTKYVAWAMDMVPDEIYNNKENFEFSVVYKKECYKGSNVTAHTYLKEEGSVTTLVTKFVDTSDENVLFCQVDTLWK